MNRSVILKQNEGVPHTKFGACFPGKRAVMRGLNLHTEFKDATWMELYVFSITGMRMAPNQLRMLEGLLTISNYADMRLWNNRVATLAGSTRSYGGAGICGALISADPQIMGRQVDLAVADFLWRALRRVQTGEDLETIIRQERSQRKIIKGFGRPVATKEADERLPVTIELLKRERVPMGPHFKLTFEIETLLEKITERPLPMTYAAIITAVTLDMGFTPKQCYLFDFCVFLCGIFPCGTSEGASFALSCERLIYDGPDDRSW
jgi:hypothetical protein